MGINLTVNAKRKKERSIPISVLTFMSSLKNLERCLIKCNFVFPVLIPVSYAGVGNLWPSKCRASITSRDLS